MPKAAPPKPPARPRRRRPAPIENNPVEDVVVGATRLGLALISLVDRFFETYGVTLLQFNVLRILYVRDPEFQGLPAGSFADRMLTINPDVPRLLDRLAKIEVVERIPSPSDRRVVLIKLTQKGIDLVEEMTPALLEHNRKLLGDMSTTDLKQLAALLQRALPLVLAARDGF